MPDAKLDRVDQKEIEQKSFGCGIATKMAEFDGPACGRPIGGYQGANRNHVEHRHINIAMDPESLSKAAQHDEADELPSHKRALRRPGAISAVNGWFRVS